MAQADTDNTDLAVRIERFAEILASDPLRERAHNMHSEMYQVKALIRAVDLINKGEGLDKMTLGEPITGDMQTALYSIQAVAR